MLKSFSCLGMGKQLWFRVYCVVSVVPVGVVIELLLAMVSDWSVCLCEKGQSVCTSHV